MIPTSVRNEIKEAVFRKADDHDYMGRGRPQNRQFMHSLLEDPEVGVKLAFYMEKSQVKTYIKDAILNQYSKQRMAKARGDIPSLLRKEFGHECEEIENDDTKKVALYAGNGHTYVVICGTYIKWESALRKALLAVTRLKERQNAQMVLILSIIDGAVTNPDIELTRRALDSVGVKCLFVKV